MKLIQFIRKFRLDLGLIATLLFSFPIFFYKLGASSLGSWDEAWYAEISRNILLFSNPFHLTFNGNPFTDHPGFGFWLISLSYSLFGISEFSTRLPVAICGILTLIVVYLLGKELFNRWVGYFSAIALLSAPWFLHRARSGNLDVILTFCFVLSLYLAIKASKNAKYLWPLAIVLIALFLTKTLVPFTILPALLIVFWKTKKDILKKTLLPILLVIGGVVGWVIIQLLYTDNYIERLIFIGLPGVGNDSSHLENLQLAKTYLHNGIGKMFWPGVFGIFVGPLLFQKRFLILSIFCLVFFIPFITSSRGHIWHMIPLYPFMIIAAFGLIYTVVEMLIKKSTLFLKNINHKYLSLVPAGVLILFCFYYLPGLIRQNWYQFIDIPAYVSDQAILSTEASKYPYQYYIDGEDFGPIAVFYSGKNVQKVTEDGLPRLFAQKAPFVLFTEQWRLDKYQIPESEYRIVKADRDKILIVKE